MLNEKGKGHPKIKGIHEDFIEMIMEENDELSSKEIVRKLQEAFDIKIATSTAREYRNKLGIYFSKFYKSFVMFYYSGPTYEWYSLNFSN